MATAVPVTYVFSSLADKTVAMFFYKKIKILLTSEVA